MKTKINSRDSQLHFSAYVSPDAKAEINKIQVALAENKNVEARRKMIFAAIGAFATYPNEFNDLIKIGFDKVNSMHGANYAHSN